MSCQELHSLLSPYLDGAVTGVQMREIDRHLSGCPACTRRFASLQRSHRLVTQIGRRTAPPELALRIRLALAREAERTPSRRLQSALVHLENALEAFMVPASAGLISAIIIFAAVMGFFALPGSLQASGDVSFYTPPALASSPFNVGMNGSGSFVIEAVIGPDGRVQDYRILSRPEQDSQDDDRHVMPQIKNALIFSTFRPATAFGMPTTGRVVLSFANINVRG